MKLSEFTFLYLYCKDKKEKYDLIALLELLEFKPYEGNMDYNFCNYVCIFGYDKIYQITSQNSHIESQNGLASEFIKDNF